MGLPKETCHFTWTSLSSAALTREAWKTQNNTEVLHELFCPHFFLYFIHIHIQKHIYSHKHTHALTHMHSHTHTHKALDAPHPSEQLEMSPCVSGSSHFCPMFTFQFQTETHLSPGGTTTCLPPPATPALSPLAGQPPLSAVLFCTAVHKPLLPPGVHADVVWSVPLRLFFPTPSS